MFIYSFQIFPGIGVGESPVSPLPVELTSFNAVIEANSVNFEWVTATEVNNYGFELESAERDVKNYSESEWMLLGFIIGNGNSNSPKHYFFRDEDLSTGTYKYRLKQIDTDGKSKVIKTIEIEFGLLERYELFQNYPNPFNPVTTIAYSVPQESNVTIKIFNSLGEEIAALVTARQNSGKYSIVFNANNLGSGIYFYRIQANSVNGGLNYIETKKMSILK